MLAVIVNYLISRGSVGILHTIALTGRDIHKNLVSLSCKQPCYYILRRVGRSFIRIILNNRDTADFKLLLICLTVYFKIGALILTVIIYVFRKVGVRQQEICRFNRAAAYTAAIYITCSFFCSAALFIRIYY